MRSSGEDAVTLIGAGITLRECLTAADELAGKGISARVIDLYSVKPVDADAVLDGGGGDAGAGHGRGPLGRGRDRRDGRRRAGRSRRRHPLTRLAVSERPGSGPPEALLAAAGIDAAHIVAAAERAL